DDPLVDQVIEPRQQVESVSTAHVADHAPCEVLAPAAAAAGIRKKNGIPMLEQQQTHDSSAEPPRAPMPHRTAVDIHNDWVRTVALRPQEPTVDLQAIRRLPTDGLHRLDYLSLFGISRVKGPDCLIPAAANDGDFRRSKRAFTNEGT